MSVFDKNNLVKSESNFFKFENIGDKVSGILRNKQTKDGQFGSQNIYTLDTKDGEKKVSFSASKSWITEIMNDVGLGDMVGFSFDESIPTNKGNTAKIINVYVEKKKIDESKLQKVAPKKMNDEDEFNTFLEATK